MGKKIEVNLAKSAGFCFGVKRALDIAIQTAKKNKQVEMLGDIVHNEDVVKEITLAGIKKIKRLGKGKNKILLVRAHGTSSKILKKARKHGYKIIDATCPMVKEIHKIAKENEKKGYRIIIIGDKKHDEVRGILGQLKKSALVIDDIKNIPVKSLTNIKKGAVIVQSTQNLDKTLKVVRTLERVIKELKFFNTICKPTQTKQEEIKILPLKNDIMIIVGSKTSANTKRLYEISKSLNKKSYWITSRKDLNQAWFRSVKKVGVATGASTPDYTTEDILECIKKFVR